ncbi:hypothetical protein AQUCO_03800078v1 [Aquilegia coerulea]|uniref:Receptor-like serine/threonine-protein kinase n=1 Tax=Aquilegia coerulea TaxID=218851 RepID=A0A2G5CSS2_AQUCA|nr:hypothetical protein AQUCO_03800078v1 [Aquilegia coerulea]
MVKFLLISTLVLVFVLLFIEVESSLRYLGKETWKQEDIVLISGNSKISNQNGSFEVGFFSPNGIGWYIGISYSSIPIQTIVWVANRGNPVKTLTKAELRLTENGELSIFDSNGISVWKTENQKKARELKLLDTGNMVLLSEEGEMVWQSFDFPTDTWLPGMKITRFQRFTSWHSPRDPSPGNYTLQLMESDYGELVLTFNQSFIYWSSGKWDGSTFADAPEMSAPYIVSVSFENPSTTSASLMYSEVSTENSLMPLTRFSIDSNGQLKEYIWSVQNLNWNIFVSRPEDVCHVDGLCGDLGFCSGHALKPCECLNRFHPADGLSWRSGDFSGGCRPDIQRLCHENDGFEEVGVVTYDNISTVRFSASRTLCEETCLRNCSCLGLKHDEGAGLCSNLYGQVRNLRNSTEEDVLYIRISRGGLKKNKWRMGVLIGGVCGVLLALGLILMLLLIWHKRRKNEEIEFPVTSLMVFSYKELYAATRGFSDKLGHGGFGAVFHGELSDSSLVAVKRLERPGGGEKEFRAEVCTIGNIQHVNLVRLRGFCSESSHRLLVYDYMPNGPLSTFLRKNSQTLSWDVRFRVAVGVAKAIAYLHEECRDCIIHCDIKPENILLDEEFTAKVSDFGMARLIGRDFSRVLISQRGTMGYVAPEWMSGVAITAKADVYSYGMTLLEIIAGRRNVETEPSGGKGDVREGTTEEKWFFPPWAAHKIIEGNVASIVDDRLVGAYNTVEAERVALVAVWCIQDEESTRPTMGTVVKMLEGTVEVTVPPPPQLLQALVSGDSFHGVGDDTNQDPSTGCDYSDDNNEISCVST